MSHTLFFRILRYALAHKDQPRWKKRLYALSYSASIPVLARIK